MDNTSIVKKAKTVDEAVEKALKELGITKEKAEIKVIDEGNRGLLGLIGGKDAVVEVSKKFNPIEEGKKFLEKLFTKANLDVEVEVVEEKTDDEQVLYNLKSPKELGLVIGHRGETLDALQYISSIVINKEMMEYYRILLDAEGYRDRRKETLERLARKMADRAVQKGRKVVLEPMPPHERRIIHMELKDNSRVKSYSEGKEPFRKVMIEPIKE
ncbi:MULTISPECIES: RNA-binding cell elongation regulator Jag/EloR [unclassified Halanaerobium]|uniref:RNA-binding cell elongation regulator Jag/EloR n=1 Tax=unclassified Halanaerobium TaxID=2641197 RepID=UPI000DF20E69|nr:MULTISPECIES: RNA-binding cell elongation regulator Jag/EloR [unclassified Halanaerobium]RCW41462.1 spoIIIJ-associated protein [Halanaerobium sp. MA284_MarDTE_T2]RCW79736.1 spoIIIJ-associated protein [Halanaerobium sp. DL-01]